MRKLLLLLLLPSLAWAGTFKVHKAEKIQQPAGTIDRVSKRTVNGKVFEFDSIGSGRFVSVISAEPIHYLDSTGTYQEFKFDTEQDTVSGFQVVRTGKFDVAFDSTGRIRYQKKDALMTLSPAFNRTNVSTDFSINPRGLKANYILLNASAPSKLAWVVTANDTVEEQSGGKGKGNLKKAGKLKGQIADFTAKDALGLPVALTASYKKDSLIVQLNTTGATYPITVDPTLWDTTDAATSGELAATGATTWLQARDSTNASTTVATTYLIVGRIATKTNYRVPLSLDLSAQSVINVVDSARVFWYHGDSTVVGTDSLIIYGVSGNFSGSFSGAWYNDFPGWAASGAYAPNYLTAAIKVTASKNVWYSTLFTAAGRDTLKAKMGAATLRMMMIGAIDISGTAASWNSTEVYSGPNVSGQQKPYFKIYYTVNPPGVTTTANADSLKPAVVLYAVIDSTGGANCTVRGFKLWPKGGTLAGDTINVSQTGSYGTGAFYIYVDSLLTDTLYRYKGYATSTGTSYGALDSFRTNLGGTSFYVDGRLVTGIH